SVTNPRCSQNPSGLSACRGINSDSRPSSRPQQWSSRVTILVPERCVPAIQSAVWVSVVLFTQRSRCIACCPARDCRKECNVIALAGKEWLQTFLGTNANWQKPLTIFVQKSL